MLVWELGDGFGHVGPLAALARGLAARGHQPVLVSRRPDHAHVALASDDVPILQAPAAREVPLPGGRGRSMSSWSDLLLMVGYRSADALEPTVRAWAATLDAVKPDFVVADFSPTAIVANAGRRPAMALGWAYTLPPRHLAQTPTVAGGDRVMTDEAILEVVRETQRRRGLPAATGTLLEAIFPKDCHVNTLPELDFFARHRRSPAIGPIQPLPVPREPVPTPGWFGYLSLANDASPSVLEALAVSGLPGELYLRDASPDTIELWRARGLTIHERPVDIAEAAGRARFVVHHGGLRTMEAILALGRPQLLAPVHIEHMMNAKQLETLGVSRVLDGAALADPGLTASRLHEIATDDGLAATAWTVANALSMPDASRNLDALLTACEGLVDAR